MIATLIDVVLTGAAAAVAVPAGVFTLQVLCAPRQPLAQARRAATAACAATRPSMAVLIPAHNEAGGIRQTLINLQAQLSPADRLLVVADNCSDTTAAIAREQGAEVTERFHDTLRGKGYALAHGFDHLALAPREVLVIVDADCHLGPDALAHIATATQQAQRPTQALYLMQNEGPASVKQRFSEFAWRVKNMVRPYGMHRFGLPCQLMGTGMGFPWALAAQHSFASGHLVEDMQLGLALAAEGKPPLFCPQALVLSQFPTDTKAQESQRTRWEHGHLSMITQTLPAYLARWVQRPTLAGLAMALDLAVPPLTLLAALLIAMSAVALGAWWLLGVTNPLCISAFMLAVFAGGVLLAWLKAGTDLLKPIDLLRGVGYAIWKLPLYKRFITARQATWVRSQRNEEKH